MTVHLLQHLIGHSLGAHVCGFFGKHRKNMDCIIGLDPAGPIFGQNSNSNRLSKFDAKIVHVIHSNIGYFG